MHIYSWQMNPHPPPRIRHTSLENPVHQNCFIYCTMHIYPWQIDPIPWPIEHRCLEYCYTKLGRSTGRSTPPIEHRCLEYCYTKLGRSTGRSTLQSIKHRCLEYCYKKLCRSTSTEGVLCKRPFTHKGNYLIGSLILNVVKVR